MVELDELGKLQEMNASQIVSKVAYEALPLFYLVPPSQSSFQTIPEVPNYVRKVRSPPCKVMRVPHPHIAPESPLLSVSSHSQ